MRLVAAACLVMAPCAVWAACPGETLLSCPVEGSGKVLEVCTGETGFTYSFGPPGAPELELSAAYADSPVMPWPGVGGSIWSSVRFLAPGYAYDATISVERNGEDGPVRGAVVVWEMPGETLLTEITCQPDSVTGELFGPEDAMAAAGYCWNRDTQVWQQGSCG